MSRHAYDKSQRTFDSDGRMHAPNCNISRANICPYLGKEIPNWPALGLDPNRIYRMYRHPDELARAADTFRNLPLLSRHVAFETDDPPTDDVCGTIGTNVTFDGEFLIAEHLTVWTQDAIDAIEAHEKEELSSSYGYDADMTPGTCAKGSYDGVMRNLRGNHVAIVIKGRAGSAVRVSDSQPARLRNMNPAHRSRLAACILALTGAAVASDAQILALDAATCNAWDGWSESERCAAMDGWRAANNIAADAQLTDDQQYQAWDYARDNAPKYKPPGASDARPAPLPAPAARALTQADIDAASRRAEDAATARVTALFAAREAVRPFVGEALACDSAEAVYRFALDQMGVTAAKTIHVDALQPMFTEISKVRQQAASAAPVRRAHDGVKTGTVSKALPGLLNTTLMQ